MNGGKEVCCVCFEEPQWSEKKNFYVNHCKCQSSTCYKCWCKFIYTNLDSNSNSNANSGHATIVACNTCKRLYENVKIIPISSYDSEHDPCSQISIPLGYRGIMIYSKTDPPTRCNYDGEDIYGWYTQKWFKSDQSDDNDNDDVQSSFPIINVNQTTQQRLRYYDDDAFCKQLILSKVTEKCAISIFTFTFILSCCLSIWSTLMLCCWIPLIYNCHWCLLIQQQTAFILFTCSYWNLTSIRSIRTKCLIYGSMYARGFLLTHIVMYGLSIAPSLEIYDNFSGQFNTKIIYMVVCVLSTLVILFCITVFLLRRSIQTYQDSIIDISPPFREKYSYIMQIIHSPTRGHCKDWTILTRLMYNYTTDILIH